MIFFFNILEVTETFKSTLTILEFNPIALLLKALFPQTDLHHFLPLLT